MFERFKKLKLWKKILIVFLAVIFFPITLLVLSILFFTSSIKNVNTNKVLRVLKIIISSLLIAYLIFFNYVFYGDYFKMLTDKEYRQEVKIKQAQREKQEQAEKEQEQQKKEQEKIKQEQQKKEQEKAKQEQQKKKEQEKIKQEQEQKKKEQEKIKQEQQKKEQEKAKQEQQKKNKIRLKNGLRFDNIAEVEEVYNKNSEQIIKKEKIRNDINSNEIALENVLNHAKNSKTILNQTSNISEKIDLSGKLVSIDDLQHNTSNKVIEDTLNYIIKEYKNNKLNNKDKLEEYLYLTRYLDKVSMSVNKFKDKEKMIFDMYQIVKGRMRNENVDENIRQVNELLY
ncbi:hypothetical protein [Clostridioides sp. ES-S-0001-02]|uniref:hypothetical protein n=1 Tax=Clostridioides sp. ES-S-0001-02 TaxID=2770770 RepID=UPI001D100984|nr:hypothetical protein [Clostridioides sp. ES-S-0001-02]